MTKVKKTCEWCGKEYEKCLSQAARSRFCSRPCQRKSIRQRQHLAATEVRSCPICGEKYETTNRHGGKKTCSQECANRLKVRAMQEACRKDKIKVKCMQCREELERFPSRIDGRMHFCNQGCKHEYQKSHPFRIATEYIEIKCTHCGKPVKRFKSRINENGHYFCNQRCYFSHTGTSSIEDTVANWLESQGLTFQQQVRLRRYIIDFRVGNIYIEVNGCYWHGCLNHCSKPSSKRIQKRIKRDVQLLEYCEKNAIKLLVIWEHDIKNGNFESLHLLIPSISHNPSCSLNS